MKKVGVFLILVLLVSGLIGCTSVPPSPVNNVKEKDYVVLGRVSVDVMNFNVLGIVFGRDGYKELYKEAEKQYGEFDEILNVYTADNYLQILYLIGRNVRTVSGLAVKYKN